MSWRPWTDEEDQTIVDLANSGAYLDEIIDALDRSDDAVQCRITHLRKTLLDGAMPAKLPIRGRKVNTSPSSITRHSITRPKRDEKTPRKCLCCGNTFSSAHSMNRLCNNCRHRDASPYAP